MSKFFNGIYKKFFSKPSGPPPTPEIFGKIIKIDNQLTLIPFPSSERIDVLLDYLKTGNPNYLIFNLSEHLYNSRIFNDQVVNYSFPGYPCPPLEATFLLLNQIDAWLISDQNNFAIVNCQANRLRSLMLAAEYLCYCKLSYPNTKEALEALNTINGVKENIKLVPSQIRYLGYFDSVFNGTIVFI